MTALIQENSPPRKPAHRLGSNDPLLQDLWAVKANLNSSAKFSVSRLAEEARQFDLEAELERIQNRKQQ